MAGDGWRMKTDFSQAIRGVKAGARYSREAWGNNGQAHIKMAKYGKENSICLFPTSGHMHPLLYVPNQPDMLTADWIELPHQQPQPERKDPVKYKVKEGVSVTAYVITKVEDVNGLTVITTDEVGQPPFPLTNDQTARYTPVVGDYYVTTADGYEYLNPKAVFEAKYEPDKGVAVS